MKRAILLAAAVTVSGCTTYDMTLLSQKAGAMGKGVAHENDGQAVIELAGRTYKGPFSYRSDKTFSVPSISVADNLPPKMEAARKKSGFVGGNGSVFAKSDDGHGLRCVFAYNQRVRSGSGACLDDAGVIYDMQINN